VAHALRDLGERVEIHDDHFAPDAKDEDWLVEVGSRGWIVLTKDDRIRYRVTERTALAVAKVKAFVLTSTQLQGIEMADAFVKALLRIKHSSPSIGLRSLAGFQDTGKSPSCDLSTGEIVENEIAPRVLAFDFSVMSKSKRRDRENSAGENQ
jgi:PIN like domain